MLVLLLLEVLQLLGYEIDFDFEKFFDFGFGIDKSLGNGGRNLWQFSFVVWFVIYEEMFGFKSDLGSF